MFTSAKSENVLYTQVFIKLQIAQLIGCTMMRNLQLLLE